MMAHKTGNKGAMGGSKSAANPKRLPGKPGSGGKRTVGTTPKGNT